MTTSTSNYKYNKLAEDFDIEETYTPVLIVGTGIGGLTTAYNLTKNNIDYIITSQGKNPKPSNTFISNANTRIPDKNEVEDIINLTVNKCGADRLKIETIYRNSQFAREFYDEIEVPIENSVFGVIPSDKVKSHGGRLIIDSLLKRVKKPVSNNHLISLDRKDDFIVAFFYNSESNKFNKIISNYLVLATGGYGSLFLIMTI